MFQLINNLPLRIKLIGNAVWLTAIVIVGTFVGFSGMFAINEQMTALYEKELQAVRRLERVESAVYHIRGDAYKYILNSLQRQVTEQAIQSEIARVEQEIAALKQMPLDDNERARLVEFTNAWTKYRAAVQGVIEATRAGKEGAAINSMDVGDAVNAHRTLNQLVTQLSETMMRHAADAKTRGDEVFKFAGTVALIGGALGVLLALGYGWVLTQSITDAVAKTVAMIQAMGKGRLKMRLRLKRQDEIGVMADTMDRFADDLQGLLNGNLARIADGDLNIQVNYFDKEDEIAIAEERIITSIRDLVGEINLLTQAAVEGKLATRGNPAKFKGAFAEVITGVNATLETVIGPLNVAATALDQLAQGTLASKITNGQFNGDFGKIKTGVNAVVDMLHTRNADVQMVIQAVSEGRLNVRADTRKYAGANGRVLDGMNSVLDAALSPMQDASGALAQVARGDLTIKLNGQYQGDFAILRDGIETMVNGLKGMAIQSQQSAASIGTATVQLLASASQMASSTREQASAVNQITSTVKQIKVTADQVAQGAQGVAHASEQAITAAEKGMTAVQETIDGMSDIRGKVEAIAENILALSEQTQQIGAIIDTVSDIAGQSNILALNAAIEAAQAGEAGRGFRVVADEVRRLAEQSRQAAAQVKNILGDIQRATNQAVLATEQGTRVAQTGSAQVQRTADTIQELARVVETSSATAHQIVAGVNQQTLGLDQIVIGMSQINQASQQTAEGARQAEQVAQNMNTLAAKLKRVVAQYRFQTSEISKISEV
ncbi:MAG: methyl-accepting chemotaxis protein [Chloroflexi bacterium]|nr:methyl-accepting chemotaxis protein [Chloroflexota bacterium]